MIPRGATCRTTPSRYAAEAARLPLCDTRSALLDDIRLRQCRNAGLDRRPPASARRGKPRPPGNAFHLADRRENQSMMKRAVPLRALPLFVALSALGCGGGTDRPQRAVIQNKGSDTLLNVAQAWAEAYSAMAPDVLIAVTGGGSGTGISAMINGTVDIANSSRQMRERELAAARDNGIEAVEHVVGYDALAVFLHEDNPIAELTLGQIRDVFGEGGAVERWSDLGVSVPGCSSDEVVRVSRQNNSGTYVYFKEAVLGGDAEFRLGSRDMHGSKDVVDLVENTPCAIGYSGLAYATEHVRIPCVAVEEGAECVAPTTATAVSGSYPIARPLFMYTAGHPRGPVKQYVEWILSDDGQCVISDRGYAPVRELACG